MTRCSKVLNPVTDNGGVLSDGDYVPTVTTLSDANKKYFELTASYSKSDF
jgi:hypothetical protein